MAGRLRELKLSESFWSGRWESNRAAVAGLASAVGQGTNWGVTLLVVPVMYSVHYLH